MKNIFGTLILSISKLTSLTFNDFKAKFDEINIDNIKSVQIELMDGTLHTVQVNDHNTDWHDYEDVNENK